MFQYPEAIDLVLTRLNQNFEAVLVGGFVRDTLLNIPNADFDLATSATPEEVKLCFPDYPIYDTGIQHGTLTLVIGHLSIEITTYRIEDEYSDSRHPDQVRFTTSLKEDCRRRDFTINALCYHPEQGILDFFHGQQDLTTRTIRAIEDPMQRFDEDALRILRAIRFSSQLNFKIEIVTKTALFLLKDKLHAVAIERCMKEFEKIIMGNHAAHLIEEYLPIFSVFIPELISLSEHPQYFQRTLDRLHRSPAILTLRLASLFCDIGCVRHTEPSAMLSASAFIDIAARLKLQNSITAKVALLIQNSTINLEFTRPAIRKRLHQWNMTFFEILNWMEVLGHDPDPLHQIKVLSQEILANNECISLKQLAINGSDCLKLGLKGATISHALQECLNQVMEEALPNQTEILLNHIKTHFM